MDAVERFEALLARGSDNALLRFSLGNAYLSRGDPETAAGHLARALEHDPGYSAAWKAYGRALAETGRRDEAMQAWRTGIDTAERNGDIQAVREMRVFLRRLEKSRGG